MSGYGQGHSSVWAGPQPGGQGGAGAYGGPGAYGYGQQPAQDPYGGGPAVGVGYGGAGGGAPALPAHREPAMAALGLPEIPDHFPELERMSLDEIKELADDGGTSTKFFEFFGNLPQVRELEAVEKRLVEENRELARANLEQQPRLEESKKLLIKKHEELNECRNKYNECVARHNELSAQLSPESIKAQLDIATQQAEENANTLVKKFKDGEIGIEEFLRAFKPARQQYHVRRDKAAAFSRSISGT